MSGAGEVVSKDSEVGGVVVEGMEHRVQPRCGQGAGIHGHAGERGNDQAEERNDWHNTRTRGPLHNAELRHPTRLIEWVAAARR